ncbi:MAG: tryptophan-rich sensory protein [Candidatus Pacebacteria bacterium]|nr:tryptophan-rich sensory protein [Candidatus Paceibacterota bacterium]
MKLRHFIELVVAVILCEGAGVIGSFFTIPSIPTWYAGLVRPALAPPNWLFAPVWTTLFALMGIAAFLVWRRGLGQRTVRAALILFIVQFVLNVLWSFIFFGLRSPGGALIEIVVLWFAILATIVAFYRVSKSAAYLLIPYILWVSFAAYLTFAIWALN